MDKIQEDIRIVAQYLIVGEAGQALALMQKVHDDIETADLSVENAAILKIEVERVGLLVMAALEGVADARAALIEAHNGVPLNTYDRDGRVEKPEQRISQTIRY